MGPVETGLGPVVIAVDGDNHDSTDPGNDRGGHQGIDEQGTRRDIGSGHDHSRAGPRVRVKGK